MEYQYLSQQWAPNLNPNPNSSEKKSHYAALRDKQFILQQQLKKEKAARMIEESGVQTMDLRLADKFNGVLTYVNAAVSNCCHLKWNFEFLLLYYKLIMKPIPFLFYP